MLTLFKNAEILSGPNFIKADVLVALHRIVHIGKIESADIRGMDVDVVDCSGCYLCPGLIDSQLLLAGGSGEDGFLSQSPRILIEECIRGGTTTVIGTTGVDTITKTMSNLFASTRAYREAGMNAYSYTGGYEIPPKTLTGGVREDILYVDEIIGAGEVAIADRRAPEPLIHDLARLITEAYVAGILSKKSGVTRIHVGDGRRKLRTIYEMLELHEVQYPCMYFTHIERSKDLVLDGIEIARHGSFVDFDIHEHDLEVWYRYYVDNNGPLEQLSFSSDAGVSSPAEMWDQIQKCALEHCFPLAQLLQHVTSVPAKALKFATKGKLQKGFDADIFVIDKKDLEIRHVMVMGKFFLLQEKFHYADQPYTLRRRTDFYGIRI